MGPAALVVAHPGHELRVHGWMEKTRPLVFVLTDGSGSSAASRLASTSAVLAGTGARAGSVYGAMTDRFFYEAVIGGRADVFTAIAQRLADDFVREGIVAVAGDASEGYNPAHDVCRVLVGAAARLVAARGPALLLNADFSLIGPPGAQPEDRETSTIRLRLGAAALARKLAAARGYPEMAAEVQAALAAAGPRAFGAECLRPVGSEDLECARWRESAPSYERYGEERVRSGVYGRVLRYRDHVLPLVAALDELSRAAVPEPAPGRSLEGRPASE